MLENMSSHLVSAQEEAKSCTSLEALELETRQDFIRHRLEIFDNLYRKYAKELALKQRDNIVITLPDGSTKNGKSWETSPANIATAISKSMLDRTVVEKVDGELWDLDRPLERSCQLEFLDFNQPGGKQVFWHSSSHILGEASERHFACLLCNGPPTTDPPGFYYDMANMGSCCPTG